MSWMAVIPMSMSCSSPLARKMLDVFAVARIKFPDEARTLGVVAVTSWNATHTTRASKACIGETMSKAITVGFACVTFPTLYDPSTPMYLGPLDIASRGNRNVGNLRETDHESVTCGKDAIQLHVG